jgi:hypothetical protein
LKKIPIIVLIKKEKDFILIKIKIFLENAMIIVILVIIQVKEIYIIVHHVKKVIYYIILLIVLNVKV